jgi:hypothetical protein
MGYWKNKLAEWEQRGYKDIDTMVCHCCFGDYAIKDYIKLHGERQKCDYCHKVRKSCSLEKVIGLIVESANTEYEDATGCMGFCSEEGGFIGADTFDVYDFVYDVLNQEMNIENEELLKDIYNTLDDSVTWCDSDPYGLRLHESDFLEWKEYTDAVKKNPSRSVTSYPILQKVANYLEELDLIVLSSKSHGFYRSRGHERHETFSTAKALGAPPAKNAAANRFSQSGQSMFYGADDIETTLAEINVLNYEAVTSAMFYPTKRLLLLDLTKIKSIKWISLFDTERRDLRSPLVFLKRFQEAISQPVNGVEEEYLPTQLFSTYLKTIFKTEDGTQLDGILYESSKIPDKECCALFFDNDDMSDFKNCKFKKLYIDKDTITKVCI